MKANRKGAKSQRIFPLFLFSLRFRAFAVKIFFLFAFFIPSKQIYSQSSLTTKTFITEDHDVLIRFAPNDKSTFDLGIKYGYVIERIPSEQNTLPDTSLFSKGTRLTVKPLLPLALNDTNWVALFRKEKNAAFVYLAIQSGGKSKSSNASDKIKAEESNFGLVLLGCDLSLDISKAVGLFYKDSTAAPGLYAYRIRLANAPKNIKFIPVVFLVDSRKSTQLKNINELKGEFVDKLVKLSWNVSENKEDYTAYIIERSEDSIHFICTNKTPYVQLYSEFEKNKTTAYYSDSLPQNGEYYWYRIKGLSHFGETGPPSASIKGKGKESLNVFPIADSCSVIGNKVTLHWRMPKDFDLKKLKGFSISRSNKTNGVYTSITKTILSPSATFFTDEQPMFSNYYLIYAINLDDDSTHSYPLLAQLKDADPPKAPTDLGGKIDSSGIVTLHWSANTENDLKGYRVFRCNSLTEEFTEVTREILSSPSFIDTIQLQTLTKNVFYSITAVDHVFNNSKFSAPLQLKRPDIIPPVAPIFKSAVHTQSAIILKWIPSSSDDVMRYELSKSVSGPNSQQKIKEWKKSDTLSSFIDTALIPGKTYSYLLTVFDESGNHASSKSPLIVFETGVRKKINDLTCTVDREARKINLKWSYEEKDIFSYVIYKAKKGEALRIWKTVKGNVNTIEDKQLYINNIYVYKIKAVLNSGAESELSDAAEVNY